MVKPKKSVFYILGILILVLIYSIFVNTTFPKTEIINVSLRNIGHKLLLKNNDTSSLVLPIKKKSNNWFEISFDSKISISPSFLTKTVSTTFKRLKLPANYIVEVKSCELNEIVYSYKMSLKEEGVIIPCIGRDLPKSCYKLNIKFLSSSKKPWNFIPYSLISIGVIIIFYFLLKKKEQKKKNITKASYNIKDILNTEERKLILNGIEIDLSEKETEILTLFLNKPNQIISREKLQKEIWEDKGVIVGRSLDTYISKLRKKLRKNSSIEILNIRGKGYKMKI
ncbi:transcriptional regulator [Maribacter vaceletii]|uniref:Transcriptional regulator n=1 Tax=Maribacter vaceletii TaxID=1206816 RepID=A0A495ECK9_9FLAO|nr:winged helix-turn-helix domain-containing protein [Maribacter vaceletii]RKR14610.1 transcriptional regulator [Maribacter vaceletii]